MLLAPALCAAAQTAGLPVSAQDSARNLAREHESLQAVCARCHTLQMVMDTPMSFDSWHDTVQTMIDRGANGTDEQLDDIMDYLHRTMTTINVNAAGAEELEIVLNVPEKTAQAILARRSQRSFTGLADLKSVPGVDASAMDAKAKLIFFK
ncbi:MAG TPA: helix-hairpin-helix domain-containing protein [Acidobacteriaceae bacterium]|nr:helix-hairpin-helix domain-containing protein [Acidobacteriaceae bacterium]